MKKNSVILAALAAILLMGTVSCKQEPVYDGEEGTGRVVIAFNFDKSATRAYDRSTSMPGTTWEDNIKSLSLFLVDDAGIIKVALPILELPTGASPDPQEFIFTNVPKGEYTGYLIANFDQTGVDPNFSANTVNQNISGLLMKLVENTSWPRMTEEAGDTAYNEAGEIFIAIRPDTDVVENITNDYITDEADHFQLKRAVSMLRVRINKNHQVTTPQGIVDNNTIMFNVDEASLRIRKVGTAMDFNGTITPDHPNGSDLIYSAKYNTSNTVPDGYTAGSLIDVAKDQSAWKDVRIYPGGGIGTAEDGTDPGDKFQIVIAGMAPVGYYPAGETTPIMGAPKLVYWSGTIEKVIAANKILEINVDLTHQGDDIIPDPVETGKLIVGVDLIDWEMEDPINMEL